MVQPTANNKSSKFPKHHVLLGSPALEGGRYGDLGHFGGSEQGLRFATELSGFWIRRVSVQSVQGAGLF